MVSFIQPKRFSNVRVSERAPGWFAARSRAVFGVLLPSILMLGAAAMPQDAAAGGEHRPVSGPVSDFAPLAHTVRAPSAGDTSIGRSRSSGIPGFGANLGAGGDGAAGSGVGIAGGNGAPGDAGAGAAAPPSPPAPDGWDRPEPGAHAGPESMGGPSQP